MAHGNESGIPSVVKSFATVLSFGVLLVGFFLCVCDAGDGTSMFKALRVITCWARVFYPLTIPGPIIVKVLFL